MTPRNNSWKIIGAGAVIATFGIAGLGFAGSSGDVKLPDSVNLRDRVPIAEADERTPSQFHIVPAPIINADSLDSPFDGSGNIQSPSGTLNPVSVSLDSPVTFSFDSPETFDSPDTPSFDTPEAISQPAPVQTWSGQADSWSADSWSADSWSFDSASFSS